MVALRGRLPILRGGGGFLLPPCGGWRPGMGARRKEAVAEAEAGPAEAEAAELSLRIPCCCCGAGLMPGGATEAQVRLNMEPGIGKKISKKKPLFFAFMFSPFTRLFGPTVIGGGGSYVYPMGRAAADGPWRGEAVVALPTLLGAMSLLLLLLLLLLLPPPGDAIVLRRKR